MCRFALVILLFCCCQYGHSQSDFDSLRNIIRITDSDSIRMSAAYLISRDICHTAPDSGIYYGKLAYKYAKNAGLIKGEASSLSQIGYSFNKKEILDSALLYWNKSADTYKSLDDEFKAAYIETNVGSTLAFFGKFHEAEKVLLEAKSTMEKLDSQRQVINILNNLGLTFDLKGDYDKGYVYYMEAFQMAENMQDENGMGTALNNMSVMYYFAEDYRKAITYGKRAMEQWSDEKYLGSRGRATKNMAVSYEFLGEIDSALMMHTRAIDIDSKMNNEFGLSKTYNNLGCLYADQGNQTKGLEYLNKALDIKAKLGIRQGISSTYNYLGKLYTETGNYKKARDFLSKGKSIAQATGSPEDLKDNLIFYTEYYSTIGDYKAALEHNKLSNALKDSLQNVTTSTKIEELNVKYETAKKDADNIALKLQNEEGKITIAKQRSTIIGVMIALGILGLFLWKLISQHNQLKLVNENLKSQKETIALLNQELNHRVKNNLTFVTTLMQMQGRRATQPETKELLKESEHRLMALSKVHGTLKSGEDTEIHLKPYIEDIIGNLQEAFNSENKGIDIKYNIASIDLDAESAMRLGLIINELMTNSMKHVDAPKVFIQLDVESDNDGGIKLKYKDNGEGIERHLQNASSSKSMGLQLINILREQLKGKVDVVLV